MPQHGPLARAALEAGKHVLVEKPMAVSLAEAAELVELAKTSRGYLLPAPHVILSDTYQAMWRRVHRGDIGKVLLARARYGWAGPNWGRWFYEPGGGSLFDLGVYNMISLTGLLGPAKRVTGMVGTAIPERVVEGSPMQVQADDNAHLLIDFGESVYAVVTTGFTMQRYRSPAIELYGTEGTLQMLGDDWAPEGYELWQNEVGAWQIFGEQDKTWPWTDGLRHMVECIRDGRRPIITPEQAYHVLEIMLKAQAAGRDGQARQIESTFTPARFEPEDEAEAAHLIHAPKRS
jgi:predicted dehydrogenase